MRSRWCVASVHVLAVAVLVSVVGATGSDGLQLVEAVKEQDARTARALLLGDGVDVNAQRADGVTALLWAAHWNDLEIVDLLIRRGARVNLADDNGVTPLHRASVNARLPMVERLLAAGADPNVSDITGLTPLIMASRTGNVDIVKALLAHGAMVNAAITATKENALVWAIAEGRRNIVRTLIEAGANVHAATEKGYTPMMFAARNGDIESARLLLSAGGGVNETAPDGTHPLAFAAIAAKDDFALFLLEQGADPDGSLAGVRALHAAAGNVGTWTSEWARTHGERGLGGRMDTRRRVRLLEALLARGADPNARITASAIAGQGFVRNGAFDNFSTGTGDLLGATPLWVTAYQSSSKGGSYISDTPGNVGVEDSEILRVLLKAGADPHLTTSDGTTSLMAAAACGRWTHVPTLFRAPRRPAMEAAVKILVEEAGVEINAVNEADFTALHCAAFSGVNEVVEYLVEHGASIDVRDWRGRTPFRIAEGAKQSFQFQAWPETAELLRRLGADTSLGIPGTLQERPREVAANP